MKFLQKLKFKMYDGCDVIYGVEVTPKMIVKAMKLGVTEEEANNIIKNCHYEFADIVNKWLEDNEYTSQCHHLRCCASKMSDFFYIGISLGEISTAYRWYVNTYDTFQTFETNLNEMIQKTKNMHEENHEKVAGELKELFPDLLVKVYTYPNDCDRCS